MAVSTTDTYSGPYAANGATVEFPFTFKAVAIDDVAVLLRFPDGTDHVVNPVLYKVTLSPQGGTVVFTDAPDGGELYIVSEPSFIQSIEFASGQPYLPSVVNQANDKAAIRDLYLRSAVDRSLKVGVGDVGIDLPPAPIRASKFMAFDADGGLAVVDVAPNLGEAEDEVVLAATTGQAVFTVEGSGGKLIDVAINGVDLTEGESYTRVGDDIVILPPCYENDKVKVTVKGGFTLQLQSRAESTKFSASLVPPPGSVAAKLQQDRNPLDAPFQATGNGAANDRTALVSTDALGPLTITANHRINTSMTFTNLVQFRGRGRLTIDSGATVTFAGGISAPFRQIFYGPGNVAGLQESRLEWFAGDADANPPTVECGAGVRKWLDSVVSDGVLKSIPMHLLCDGTSPYDVSKGQTFAGPGPWQLFLEWPTPACNGFRFPVGNPDGATFSGFQWRMKAAGMIPTSGTALDIRQSYCDLSDFFINDCYRAIDLGNVVATFMEDFQLIGSVKSAIRTEDRTLDYHFDKFIIQALYDWVTLSSVSGTFSAGDSFTFNGGQTGTIIEKYDATHYRMRFVGPAPTVGMAISKTGASGTISSLTIGHDEGAMVLLDTGEAVTIRAGDVLGGRKGLVTFTAGTGERDGFAYSRLTDVYFDSSYEGSSMTRAFGCVLTAAWFASSANTGAPGLTLDGCRRMTLNVPQFVNNGGPALSISSTCEDIEVIGLKEDGNCVSGGLGAVYIQGGAKNVRFTGGKAGYQGANGITPPKSFYWDAGDSQRMMMNGVDVPSGTVVDNSTASQKTFVGIAGIAFRNL